MTQTYRIVRMYKNAPIRQRTLKRGLTLEQAQAHCSNPETSSSTCKDRVNLRRTIRVGHWFDGYEAE